MNDIDKMPPKCHDCPYWEIADLPYNCDCQERYEESKRVKNHDSNITETVPETFVNQLKPADVITESLIYDLKEGLTENGTVDISDANVTVT